MTLAQTKEIRKKQSKIDQIKIKSIYTFNIYYMLNLFLDMSFMADGSGPRYIYIFFQSFEKSQEVKTLFSDSV